MSTDNTKLEGVVLQINGDSSDTNTTPTEETLITDLKERELYLTKDGKLYGKSKNSEGERVKIRVTYSDRATLVGSAKGGILYTNAAGELYIGNDVKVTKDTGDKVTIAGDNKLTISDVTISGTTITGGVTIENPTITAPSITNGTLTSPTITNPTITGVGTASLDECVSNKLTINSELLVGDGIIIDPSKGEEFPTIVSAGQIVFLKNGNVASNQTLYYFEEVRP